MAIAASFTSGSGSLVANTSYVGIGSAGGTSCPLPTGWSLYPPQSPPSTGEAAGGMVYDSTDGYVLYFGGYAGSGTYVGSTWEYAGGCWKDLGVLSTSPDGRSEFGMVWDGADGKVLLFGGSDAGTQCSSSNSWWFYMCGDTWEYSGGSWTNVCSNGDVSGQQGDSGPTCGTTPPPLVAPMMVYDPVNADCTAGATAGCVILFGGLKCTASCDTSTEDDGDSSSVYEFFANAWHGPISLSGGPPPARDSGQMVYDSTDGYVLLYGGEVTSCQTGNGHCTYTGGSCDLYPSHDNYCDDAWSLKSGTWTQQCKGGQANWNGATVSGDCIPPGAEGNAMAYDGFQSYVVDYGGFNAIPCNSCSPTSYSDSNGYVYGVFGWNGNYGGSGSGNWNVLTFPGGASPVSRYFPSLAYDAGTQDSYLILFGGANAVSGYTATMYVYK